MFVLNGEKLGNLKGNSFTPTPTQQSRDIEKNEHLFIFPQDLIQHFFLNIKHIKKYRTGISFVIFTVATL